MTIPVLHPITAAVRMPNDRLWELHRKCAARTATKEELDELEAICAAMEARNDGNGQ